MAPHLIIIPVQVLLNCHNVMATHLMIIPVQVLLICHNVVVPHLNYLFEVVLMMGHSSFDGENMQMYQILSLAEIATA